MSGRLAVLMLFFLLPGLVMAMAGQAASAPPPGTLAQLTVSRLDPEPAPVAVVDGASDAGFAPVAGGIIHEFTPRPRWWRITADRWVSATDQPQLVLHSPGHNTVEAWLPGSSAPITRALLGPDADHGFSSRGLVIPLPSGLAAGESIYLRVQSPVSTPMAVSIESLYEVHRADLAHVAWRAVLLGGLGLMALLALGFWIGIGERGYAYLSLGMLAQVGFFATHSGDIRMVPALAEQLGADWRLPRLFVVAIAILSVVFLTRYLNMRARQPALWKMVSVCVALFAIFTVSTWLSEAEWVPVVGNLILLLGAVLIMVAAVHGCLQRRRSAYFVLVAWLPMMALLIVRVGETSGLWSGPPWLMHALPGTLVLAGLVFMIGLSDTLQQLRRDRDRASRLASVDVLTGSMSRPAIQNRLQACVEESHRRRIPMSVVFFDIDRFKRINDEYGHGIGDSCLKIIALRTRNRLRTYDSLGRWGGDELLVVLPDTHLEEAMGVAENLRSAVNCRPLSIDGHLFDASLSLGVAELAEGETAAQLLDRVDAALYASKAAGRDRVTGRVPVVAAAEPA
ncbi:diguanylate cyclase [Novilysobacter antarcticus]|uniref:diguanylate cyclase n=1 Tax=Novilysobacter antarcticus TaxID=2862543 RepID=UPI001C99C9B3